MINGKNSEIGVYCGSKRPPMLMSHDNRLEVLFNAANQQSQAKGFKAIYKFVTGNVYLRKANTPYIKFNFK